MDGSSLLAEAEVGRGGGHDTGNTHAEKSTRKHEEDGEEERGKEGTQEQAKQAESMPWEVCVLLGLCGLQWLPRSERWTPWLQAYSWLVFMLVIATSALEVAAGVYQSFIANHGVANALFGVSAIGFHLTKAFCYAKLRQRWLSASDGTDPRERVESFEQEPAARSGQVCLFQFGQNLQTERVLLRGFAVLVFLLSVAAPIAWAVAFEQAGGLLVRIGDPLSILGIALSMAPFSVTVVLDVLACTRAIQRFHEALLAAARASLNDPVTAPVPAMGAHTAVDAEMPDTEHDYLLRIYNDCVATCRWTSDQWAPLAAPVIACTTLLLFTELFLLTNGTQGFSEAVIRALVYAPPSLVILCPVLQLTLHAETLLRDVTQYREGKPGMLAMIASVQHRPCGVFVGAKPLTVSALVGDTALLLGSALLRLVLG